MRRFRLVYDPVGANETLRQGDIFRRLPSVDVQLQQLENIVGPNEVETTTWEAVANVEKPLSAVFSVMGVPAILATPDCDNIRSEHVALFEIRRFTELEPTLNTISNQLRRARFITRETRAKRKWFYMPPHALPGFKEAMGVDFRSPIRVRREDLLALRALRSARLFQEGREHFSKAIAAYFEQYGYNEWYPLLKAEFSAYQDDSDEAIQPYPWQK